MKKRCPKCKKNKSVDNFGKDRKRKDGLQCWCKDCQNSDKMKYYYRNVEVHKKRVLAYRAKNIDKYKAYQKKWWQELKQEAMNRYGKKCLCCGEKELVFLTIDHIKGNGNAHRRAINSRGIYQWLRKNNYPKGFQVLCWNCNSAKHILGKCPHKKLL